MQWIHVPSQSNVDNLNNVRCDARWHFRNKMEAYRKAKIKASSKIKNTGHQSLQEGLPT
jgi:hypothetical protein